MFFFFKQKTAYEMRISDWSSDVCSSDLHVSSDPDTLVLITGVVIEFIAAAFLWVYRFSIQQQTYYYRRQIRLHNALLAHRLTGDMTQAKDESRSEERRVGKERDRTCRSRVAPCHQKKKKKK